MNLTSMCSSISIVSDYSLPTTSLSTCNPHCYSFSIIKADSQIHDGNFVNINYSCMCENTEIWHHYENCNCYDTDVKEVSSYVCNFAETALYLSGDYYETFLASNTEDEYQNVSESNEYLDRMKDSITAGSVSRTTTSKFPSSFL
ncbi:hypothetical protein MGE_03621 [Candida albicans P75010]|nr:hypothetical protein MGE_03621 [Candida albicans P75010]